MYCILAFFLSLCVLLFSESLSEKSELFHKEAHQLNHNLHRKQWKLRIILIVIVIVIILVITLVIAGNLIVLARSMTKINQN